MSLPKLTLVLGGAASGKSAFAERLVLKQKTTRLYVATAQGFDDEMRAKIKRHREQRGPDWTTVEVPFDVSEALDAATADQTVLLDCVTLWLTNILLADRDIASETDLLVTALKTCAAPVVVVSNEVGQGIVPDNALSRRFRNAQGALNQAIAAEADCVVAVMAGLPLALKGPMP